MTDLAKATNDESTINLSLTVAEMECLLHDVNNHVLIERSRSDSIGNEAFGEAQCSIWERIRRKLMDAAEQQDKLFD